MLSPPRPDTERSPHPDCHITKLEANININNDNLDNTANNTDNNIKNIVSEELKLAEVIPKKRNSNRCFLAYDGYTVRQLSRLFLFPGRGKKVETIRFPRGPDMNDSRGFKVPRKIGILG